MSYQCLVPIMPPRKYCIVCLAAATSRQCHGPKRTPQCPHQILLLKRNNRASSFHLCIHSLFFVCELALFSALCSPFIHPLAYHPPHNTTLASERSLHSGQMASPKMNHVQKVPSPNPRFGRKCPECKARIVGRAAVFKRHVERHAKLAEIIVSSIPS